MTAPQGTNSALLLPKLFARILSALGMTLKKKSENYDDPALSNLFLLNNYNYIAKALEDDEDGLLPVIKEQNTQILSFYRSEIEQYINHYIRRYIFKQKDCVHSGGSLSNRNFSAGTLA
ncbi:hypothetical protein OESDEN_09102 [Oesophagostomum dentatum]|uniref:Exocyst complex component 7 n=1 Tax=Oesophagostomum dentatum TaxID=61180 RepID=A0A0B1T4G6_OESDE|nr:hypothetical protein OESDEN_09102 [Oesophagostomum dentatum]